MSSAEIRLEQIRHPHHDLMYYEWEKFRLAFEGGVYFKNKYLKKFSDRETDTDFARRKSMTHVPAHAKAAIMDVRNAIYQRMADISRIGGPANYRQLIHGYPRGVDGYGNSMNGFVGKKVLPELLVLGRVGIFVDKPQLPESASLADVKNLDNAPYLYTYQAEDILSWKYDELNELEAVLLRDHIFHFDETTQLTTHRGERFRLLKKVYIDNGLGELVPKVLVQLYASTDAGPQRQPMTEVVEEMLLDLPMIPFVLLELETSLMTDIADYQISLLNLASSDMAYALKSNFPFYTEQYSPAAEMPNIRSGGADSTEAGTGQVKEVNIGPAQGRRYPQGIERPGFIHPSSEPLRASMEKQQQLKEEIRNLLNLNLSNLRPMRASAESKDRDNQGLEGGLAAIGLELEYGERRMAQIWNAYEGWKDETKIKYPGTYNLRTDEDRRQEASELRDIRPTVPSKTFQELVTKKMVRVLLGGEATNEQLEAINKELEAQSIYSIDPEVIRLDHEAGFVSTKTASESRGYPEGEAEQAAKDHAERLARIAEFQSSGGTERMASRGVDDADPDSENSASEEKEDSRNTDQEETTEDRTRGEGQ